MVVLKLLSVPGSVVMMQAASHTIAGLQPHTRFHQSHTVVACPNVVLPARPCFVNPRVDKHFPHLLQVADARHARQVQRLQLAQARGDVDWCPSVEQLLHELCRHTTEQQALHMSEAARGTLKVRMIGL
jgi:hypothetical protein